MRVFILGLAVVLGFSGCATTQLQTQAKTTRAISLSPQVLSDKRVWLRVTGTEASILELKEPLEEALQSRGVTLVADEKDASIALHVHTLFAHNLKEAANYHAAGVGGGVAGVFSRASGSSSSDSILVGVGVALAMGVADRALADEVYRAIVEVSMRVKEGSAWGVEERTRVLAEALKMGLEPQEAKETMEKQVVYHIAEILH